ncbi:MULTISPECIES: hypothetical protein [Kitasatospora]|uniref:Uncharacterized protein n=1 Tax=Kitasatospora setae (strain ATCC 33774 / DSM 43861 / JCM 3304 / KCC A-0304 / NBRC 14216 / KM-6054) TaxID=452652 RepID=E4NCY0_KITSK|nr:MULTISPECIES: hypothetical protein [Kitasatospora]BAJ29061.1 hypothetical protein KSE_32520 [Kitasatospora setae KM-6054]
MGSGADGWLAELDAGRERAGLRTVTELLELARHGTVLHDPFSALVSRRVVLGTGNTLYPGVTLECDEDSVCELGDGNVLRPGTAVLAAAGGTVRIGSGNLIGDGGARLKANRSDAEVRVGDRTRLAGGPEVVGRSLIGDGCQLIGAITAQSVRLAGGGDHTHPDPDGRGAVLKGFGLARGLVLERGEVVNGAGDFAAAPVERQRAYHPGAPRL